MLRISGGYLKGRQISVRSKSVKPTSEVVRQAFFNLLDVSGISLLDLFSGSGIVGIEAISRGAKFVCFVDSDLSLIKQLKSNLEYLQVSPDKYRIIHSDWARGIKILAKESKRFDIIFADPFYNFIEYNKLIISLKDVLKENGIIIIESSSRNTFEIPEDFNLISSKNYGETIISFISIKF